MSLTDNIENHPYCRTHPRGWFGHGYTLKNPAKVKLDYDLFLPDGKMIPAGTEHLQWETQNFGWWKWATITDNNITVHLSKY